ncbi:Sulfite reductase (ferredoxin) [termite gut metagenome]|uniref:Sulfite reductase (Ferredoxin) n=1 Tax=termite gut metagenome TaxID=433724 RepID=A0A5J4S8U2_9ZZZZ
MYRIPETLNNDIARLGALAKEYREEKIDTAQFKTYHVPMGVYEQRTDGTYMARIRTTGGVISPEQYLQVIDIAQRHGSDLLHITTRQEIQIQNLSLEEIEPVMYELKDTGLSTKGGGGNTVRNMLVSEESGILGDEVFDTTTHAIDLTSKMITEADSYTLPRKLKIAFASDDKRPDYAFINDLGLIAKTQNGERGFKVYVGGGGGGKPSVGWLLFDFIPESELFIVAEAVKKMFSEHGDRENRSKARIRHIFYRLGEEEAICIIKKYYEEAKKTTPLYLPEKAEETGTVAYAARRKGVIVDSGYISWKKRYVTAQRQEGYDTVLVPFVWGNLRLDDERRTEAFKKLLRFVSQFGKNTIRFTTTQNVRLRYIPDEVMPELYLLIKDAGVEVDVPLLVNKMISCTGADMCRLGVCFSKGLVAAIRKELINSSLDLDRLPVTTSIHVSGCPNSCGQQLWADIGFSGKILRSDRAYPGYQVYLAASRNDNPRLAEPVGNMNARDIPKFVVELLASYLKVQPEYPTLTSYLETKGKADAIGLLSKYKDVPSFADDKNYYFDWGAEDIFNKK